MCCWQVENDKGAEISLGFDDVDAIGGVGKIQSILSITHLKEQSATYTSFPMRRPEHLLEKVVSEIAKINIKNYMLQWKLTLGEEIINQYLFLFYR